VVIVATAICRKRLSPRDQTAHSEVDTCFASGGRSGRCGAGGEDAGGGGNSRDHGRPGHPYRSGLEALVELAETLQAPVVSGKFPTNHPLSQGGGRNVANADVILGLEVADLWGTINNYRDQQERSSRPLTKPGTKIISISAEDLFMKSNYQDFQRYTEVDIAIAADAEATLPSLVEACKRLITADRRRALDDRGRKLAAAHAQGSSRRARRLPTHGTPARSVRRAWQRRSGTW